MKFPQNFLAGVGVLIAGAGVLTAGAGAGAGDGGEITGAKLCTALMFALLQSKLIVIYIYVISIYTII